MTHPKRVGNLEVGQDMAYQRREWLAERAGWVIMALVIAAALAGLLGRGPLSSASTSDAAGTLKLEYDRFLHHHNPTLLKVTVASGAADAPYLRLWVSRSYLEHMRVNSILPEPERHELGADRHHFVFRVADKDTPLRIIFHIEPDDFGNVPGQLGIDGGATLSFGQFIYP